MESSKILLLLALAAAVSSNIIKGNRCEFDYDCSGKVDGNYPHPNLCTSFVSCTAEVLACEMECQLGPRGQQLHYVQDSGPNPETSRCDYPEYAGCTRDPFKAGQ